MLENIKLVLDIDNVLKDKLLIYLIKSESTKVMTYTNNLVILPEMESLVEELVIIRYNKLGSEGLQSESYSGISQTFIQDIPEAIKSQLNKYRRLKTI